ncbi:myb/SANT-like DNA-binding domain-containing protein 3 [Ostrinia nubilalis]|uniref:myb/SANT-like DNA-binding domain-containing protein 3 n=1 Tax=Ostrinia furnacalis TaxID=93504 RepID=UPI00103BD8E5|nr:myb/SANT-like DNA-binding domain-containing protein 3 [Ostrinia furnacalis]
MDDRKRRRGMYVTARQKKKLVELVTKHPELIACKVTQDFNYTDSQKLWQSIASECNNIPGPGARKTWRQWRKTWQDLRSKTKKRQAEINGEVPSSVVMLTPAEQEALGLKNVSSTTNYQETTEFVPIIDPDMSQEYNNELDSVHSYSEPESPPEAKVFEHKEPKVKSCSSKQNDKHGNNCFFNCDLLASSEQRKMQLKEDYISFKKDYLRQKLKLIKEQTEALKSIARELSK